MGDLEVLSIIEDIIYKEISKRLSASRVKLADLSKAPSEFRAESLNDPLAFRSYQHFMMLKNSYKEPVALLVYYIFEKKFGIKVKEIYYHDLIAGSPAWREGYSGRDLDLVIVVDRKPDLKLVKRIEKYVDDIVSLAIWIYFKEKGEIDDYKPFNSIIGHNLVELHVITEDEKGKFLLDGGLNDPKVERADINYLNRKLKEIEEKTSKYKIATPIKYGDYLTNLGF